MPRNHRTSESVRAAAAVSGWQLHCGANQRRQECRHDGSNKGVPSCSTADSSAYGLDSVHRKTRVQDRGALLGRRGGGEAIRASQHLWPADPKR